MGFCVLYYISSLREIEILVLRKPTLELGGAGLQAISDTAWWLGEQHFRGEIGARMNKISSAAWRRKAGTLGDAHTRSEGDTILVGSGSNPDTLILYPRLNRKQISNPSVGNVRSRGEVTRPHPIYNNVNRKQKQNPAERGNSERGQARWAWR